MNDKISKDTFDINVWKREIAEKIKENPELAEMTGKLGLHLSKGNLGKVKIEDKLII